MTPSRPSRYWRSNLFLICGLLALWGGMALGCGVLWVEHLNRFRIGQLPLGFWMSQQGTVIGFVGLVFAYAIAMDRLDRQHAIRSQRQRQEQPDGPASDPVSRY